MDSSVVVEIHAEDDVEASILDFLDLDKQSAPQVMDLNGHRGVCIGQDEDDQYIVRTFENVVATMPIESLRSVDMSDDVDAIWNLSADFASYVSEAISMKGFCVVQMFSNSNDRAGMASEADGLPTFRMAQEVETAFMGLNSNSKLARLPMPDGDMPESGLAACDGYFSALAGMLRGTNIGFEAHGRTMSFIRSSYKSAGEELQVSPQSIESTDGWAAEIGNYLRFQETRVLNMLHLIENEGGDLWLYPRDKLGQIGEGCIKLSVSSNKLVLFRHDWFDFSYQPLGRSLALQAWISTKEKVTHTITNVQVDMKERWAFANPGLPEPSVPAGHVMAMHANMPGEAVGEHCWWTVFAAGMDGVTAWPVTRYDEGLYYSSDAGQAFSQGKSYSKHGGFASESQFTQFDNHFFGISNADANLMIPTARLICETGITVLQKAGYAPEDLRGAPIGTWLGDCGPDWHCFYSEWHWIKPEGTMAQIHQNIHTNFTAGRLAHIFGMTGPVANHDTACSSSLVALNQAHSFMMCSEEECYNNSLVMGVNVMFSHIGYLSCTSTNMLSYVGRSFTFNTAADGYCRGEGNGGLFLKKNPSAEEVKNRIGSIIGSCCNHDGRTATLTAPNGPAQQALIKRSMAFAQVDPKIITMSEFHGTGTPLGDPIEVNAFHAVMAGRTTPLLEVSTKSHIGHLEPGAGIAGIMKCLMMIRYSCGPPNVHLNVINQHIADENSDNPFPRITDSELTDTGVSSGYCGVSSFGFAGTNARCDVYNTCSHGARKAMKADLPPPSLPRYRFDGNDDMYIVGSWNGWGSCAPMEQELDGTYVCYIALGETRVETFRLKIGDVLDEESDYKSFYPAIKNAGTDEAEVFGPDSETVDRRWMINGFLDEKPVGTVYKIHFQHGAGHTRVFWNAIDTDDAEDEVLGASYRHEYFLRSAFRENSFLPMLPVPGSDGLYEVTFPFNHFHRDEFRIVRDKDLKQGFYLDPDGDCICGPSDITELKRASQFVIQGRQHTLAKVQLAFRHGYPTLRVETQKSVVTFRANIQEALLM